MNVTIDKLRSGVGVAAVLLAVLAAELPLVGQSSDRTNAVIPLIVMDNVPLSDAIANLARQAGINYILDPQLSGLRSNVSRRWENKSAEETLTELARDHNLTIVTNPATSVTRISPSNHLIKPVPAEQVGPDTNAVIPLISLSDVPLDEAIRKLAGQAQLKVELEPAIRGLSSKRGQLPEVSVRWQNISARQALAALLDNYNLSLIEDPNTGIAKLKVKDHRPQTSPGNP